MRVDQTVVNSDGKELNRSNSDPSVFNGAMLIAGAVVGAGMFSLPLASSGMWFAWSAMALIATWALSYFGSIILLETNLHYPRGASFNTFVVDLLGPVWNVFAGVSLVFLLYILMYAYFSAGGSILLHSFEDLSPGMLSVSSSVASLIYGAIVATMVWFGTGFVSRISVILLGAMVITFLGSNVSLFESINLVNLFDSQGESRAYHVYIWAALPVYLASFGCASMVPSLVKHYGHQPKKISQCFFYGTLISLVVYLLWMLVNFGNLPRDSFIAIDQAGGNMGDLVAALAEVSSHDSTRYLLQLFSNFALTSSFLAVGLSLFDYMADKFKFDNTMTGRFKSAAVAFIPPAIFSFFYPHGFVRAIGYAGFALFFSYFLIPYLMLLKNRRITNKPEFRVGGNLLLVHVVFGFSALIAAFKLLSGLEVLSVYTH